MLSLTTDKTQIQGQIEHGMGWILFITLFILGLVTVQKTL